MTPPRIDVSPAPETLLRMPPAQPPAPLPSAQLLQGRKAIEISHNGAVYRLQQTRQGKLILTK
ncbi:hemin uptake protein HemP [Ottowia testudinis]|uniref:Hemin uptake protein HemP n=1 Tax=Ottowia testudinis TaxID=2816950 RepID=A0A975CH30_9BURK|nr:hemin uptake protein HemP [Ottowia testudinis]